MKKQFLLSLLVVACAFASIPAQAELKIATVDMRKLVEKYWKRPQRDQILADKAAALEKEKQSLIDMITKANEELGKLISSANDQSVTSQERDKRRATVEQKKIDIEILRDANNKTYAAAVDQFQTTEKRMTDKMVDEIRAAVSAKGHNAGYDLVLDTSAYSLNQIPMVLYTSGQNDITESILTQLNAGAPSSALSTTNSSGTNAVVK